MALKSSKSSDQGWYGGEKHVEKEMNECNMTVKISTIMDGPPQPDDHWMRATSTIRQVAPWNNAAAHCILQHC